MNTQFVWNAKTRKLRDLFDKQIEWSPKCTTLYLKPKEFKEILSIIPEEYKKHYFDGIPIYRDKPIKIMPGVK